MKIILILLFLLSVSCSNNKYIATVCDNAENRLSKSDSINCKNIELKLLNKRDFFPKEIEYLTPIPGNIFYDSLTNLEKNCKPCFIQMLTARNLPVHLKSVIASVAVKTNPNIDDYCNFIDCYTNSLSRTSDTIPTLLYTQLFDYQNNTYLFAKNYKNERVIKTLKSSLNSNIFSKSDKESITEILSGERLEYLQDIRELPL